MSRAKALIEAMVKLPEAKDGRSFSVAQYKDGKREATVSGMGRNKNKWDSAHGRRSAQRHAKSLRSKQDGYTYKVEEN